MEVKTIDTFTRKYQKSKMIDYLHTSMRLSNRTHNSQLRWMRYRSSKHRVLGANRQCTTVDNTLSEAFILWVTHVQTCPSAATACVHIRGMQTCTGSSSLSPQKCLTAMFHAIGVPLCVSWAHVLMASLHCGWLQVAQQCSTELRLQLGSVSDRKADHTEPSSHDMTLSGRRACAPTTRVMI